MNLSVSSFRLIISLAIYRLQLPTGKPAKMGTGEKKHLFLSACGLQLNALTDLELEVAVSLKHRFLAKKELVVTAQ